MDVSQFMWGNNIFPQTLRLGDETNFLNFGIL